MSRTIPCSRAFASLAKLLALAALLLFACRSAAAQTQSYAYSPGEVLIKFVPGTSPADITAILSDLGATRVTNLRQIGASQERITNLSVDQAIARYRGDRRVLYIEPNYIVHAVLTPNDSLFGQLWGMHNTGQTGGVSGADIHATQAWDVSTGSPNVLVAIIDTGVDYTHPDLASNIFVNPGEIPNNGIDDDGNGFIDDVHGWDFVNHDNDPIDDFGHGTHVSGTVAAAGNNGLGVVGVCWKAKLLPLKFLNSSGSGTTADAISAIQYATQMGVRVMSNSWGGGGYSQALYDAIKAAGDAGILFVAAAGNASSNNDLNPSYPASYDLPNIISVAASDPYDNLAYFSNYGATTVDLAAPGTDILSTFPGGGYQFESGTSMATPHVSGALALIMSRFPQIDGVSAKNLLLANVDPESAFAGITVSGGRLNAFKPLLVADSIPPAAITDVAVVQINGDWVNLQWTASGDDGTSGRAARYEIRYSTSPITSLNFAAATLLSGPPDPLPAGMTQLVRVNGLSFMTAYYFAVKAFDELGNPSPLSNVASATTLGAPAVGVAPDSLSADLLTGGKATRTLTISNSGAGELRFDIGQEVPGNPLASLASVTAATGKAALRAPRLGGKVLTSNAAYNAGHAPRRVPLSFPSRPPSSSVSAVGLRILLLESGSDASEIRGLLAAFPDIATVDEFDASVDVPTLDQLRGYNTVITIDGIRYGDADGVGNVLADFVDGGGGLVMTLATFINGWAIGGRLLSGGYIPFNLGSGPVGSSTLGSFDASHPIMQGVTAISGDLLGQVTLATGAKLVASWVGDPPFVATQGDHVAAVNIFFGGSGYWTGDAPLLMHNAAFWAGGSGRFLAVAPDSGVVPAGGSSQVQVTFDATGQNGGDYRLNIRVHSNDPATPKVLIPAHLHVTGAPDILVTPVSLEYGQLFIGAAKPESVIVTNRGTDLLSISGVTVTPGVYTAPLTGFDLAPGQRRTLIVTFAPTTAAVIPGTLQISSNDPDQPQVSVALHGEGLVAPDIAVAPDSFSVALLTGQSAQRTLVIKNTGGSNLTFAIATRATGLSVPATAPSLLASMARAVPLTNLAQIGSLAKLGASLSSAPAPKVWIGANVSAVGGTPAGTRGAAKTLGAVRNSVQAGNDILVLTTVPIDSSLGRALAELGHSYDIIFTDNFTGIDFTPYHTIVVAMDGGSVETASCQALANAAAGGRLLMMFGGTTYPPYYSGVQTYLLSHTGETGWKTSAPPHLTVVNAGDPLASGLPSSTNFIDPSATYYMLRINDPAASVAAQNGDNHPALVHKSIGAGTLVYFTNSPFTFYWSNPADYAILKQIVKNALTLSPASWLSATPDSGVVTPGNQVSVQVNFNALGLNGGDYRADVLITSNDPDESPYAVPAHLHVTGAPDILVTPVSLDYGQLFIGAAKPESVIVTNRGSDLLNISGVTVTPGVYSAPLTGFDLSPGQSRTLIVTFAPTTAAVVPGTLQISSNDPDQPQVSVALHGEGLVAPDIAVAPDSFSVALLTGQSAQRTLVIKNTGGSNLTFAIGTRATGLSVPATAPPLLANVARALPLASASRLGTRMSVVQAGALSMLGASLSSASAPKVWSGASVSAVGGTPAGTRGAAKTLGAVRNSVQAGNDILVLSTTSIDSSLGRALTELGHSYDIMFTDNFTGIDFSPYHTIVVAMAGGATETASCQALANAAASGRLVLMVGGTDYGPFYSGVQTYLLSQTGETGWTIPAPPHLTVVSAADPLASNLPPATTYNYAPAAYYMLRVNDPLAVVVANNGDNHPALLHKAIGAGTLVYFLADPYDGFWAYPADFAILKQVVKNALQSGSVSWLSATPDSGGVAPGNQVAVQVGFDASGLNGGEYRAELQIISNDPDESPYAVPVHMHVTGAPVIGVVPDSLKFGALFIGAAKVESVLVTNKGSDVLNVSGVTTSPGQFSTPAAAFSLAPGQSRSLGVTFTPTAVSAYTGSLDIQSNDAGQPVRTVVLTGQGLIAPTIAVAPESLSVSLLGAGQISKPVDVSNTGGSDLSFSIFVTSAPGPAPSGPDLARASRARRAGATSQREDGSGSIGPNGASGLMPMLKRQLALISPQAIAFYDDMEHGDNGWTRQVYGVDDLWHRTTRASNSPVTSWWCGIESTGTYQTSNPIRTAAVSPVIDLRYLQAPVTLQFYENFQTESGYDFCMVDVEPDTGSFWTPLRGGIGSAPSGNSGGWRVTTLDMSPWAGQRVRIRYYFDTIDPIANNYPGWFFDDVMVTAAGVSWLSVAPSNGTVPAGGKQTVQATFNSANLLGGDYAAQIRVLSNDPTQPTVVVPAHLHVTGVPDILVAPLSLDYGQLFIGAAKPESVIVTNRGSDLLSISGVSAAPGAYTVATTGFDLSPGQSRTLIVTFAPTTAAVVPGTLQISSNDPDQPQVSVALHGEGLVAPDIAVAPDSFSVALLTGQSAQRTLVIKNTGGSNLTFAIATRATGLSVPATAPSLLASVARALPLASASRSGTRTAVAQVGAFATPGAKLSSASAPTVWTGANVTAIGGTPEATRLAASALSVAQNSVQGGNDILLLTTTVIDSSLGRALTELGHGYDIIFTQDFTGIDFSPYHTIIVAMDGGAIEAASCQALANAAAGGRLLFMLGGTSYPPYYSGVQSYLLSQTGETGWQISATPHLTVVNPADPLAAGLPSPSNYLNLDAAYYVLRINDPVAPVAAQNGDNHPALVHKSIGAGSLIYFTSDPVAYFWYNPTDYAILKQIVKNALASGPVGWLSATPDSGVVAAGNQVSVQIGFNASGLFGGEYRAELQIISNDPDESPYAVPVHMHVTGAADIVAYPTALEFGQVFVGGAVVETVLVTSDGSDSLKVSSIDVVNAAFSAPSAGFTLPIGGTRKILVTYHPTAIGNSNGTLTIHSNDPDNSALLIPLHGEGIEAPNVAFMPSLLQVSIAPNDVQTRNMRLDNLGGTPLIWFIDIGGAVSAQFVAHETGLDSLALIAYQQHASGPAAVAVPAAAMKAAAARGSATAGRAGARLAATETNSVPALSDVLTQLDSRFTSVTSVIPNHYEFTEGVTGSWITDGGLNMYDTGNILGTNLGGSIPYSNDLLQFASQFGGSYFTRKYPGLFVLAADISGVSTFNISGDLGADGNGADDGSVLNATLGGVTYRGYVKRVYGAGVPSVNHMIILPNPGQTSHGFALSTNNDFDSVGGLASLNRIYYLLFAGNGGSYIGDADMIQIMEQFLTAISPSPLWLSAIPSGGTLQGHDHITVGARFDSHGLAFGDYNAQIFLHSNDPDEPVVTVPVTMSVVENPTATDAALYSSSAAPGKVELVWYAAGAAALTASVYRQVAGHDWALLGPVSADGQGYLRFEDDDVVSGASYGYRLGITESGATRFVGETWVEVPRTVSFALHGMQPNPAVHELNVAFSLPDAQPATLELLDLAGRRLRSQPVGNQGAGRHVVSLGPVGALPSGMYMVRIQRGDHSLIAKCVVMQ